MHSKTHPNAAGVLYPCSSGKEHDLRAAASSKLPHYHPVTRYPGAGSHGRSEAAHLFQPWQKQWHLPEFQFNSSWAEKPWSLEVHAALTRNSHAQLRCKAANSWGSCKSWFVRLIAGGKSWGKRWLKTQSQCYRRILGSPLRLKRYKIRAGWESNLSHLISLPMNFLTGEWRFI